jgi:hypothetical protein
MEELAAATGHEVTMVRSRHKGGFAVRTTLAPPVGVPRRITIDFHRDGQDIPSVWVAGGPASPHRYADDSLCMWYPSDPVDRRWTWRQGAQQLAAQICAHMIREHYWAHTGVWHGEEAPHD